MQITPCFCTVLPIGLLAFLVSEVVTFFGELADVRAELCDEGMKK